MAARGSEFDMILFLPSILALKPMLGVTGRAGRVLLDLRGAPEIDLLEASSGLVCIGPPRHSNGVCATATSLTSQTFAPSPDPAPKRIRGLGGGG